MKQHKKLFIVLCLLVMGLSGVHAQITVSGTVTDAKGEAQIGVNVIVKGTSKGTISDLSGKYEISVPETSSVLVFSYLGFEKQEQKVGNRKTISVVMAENSKALDEVVVIGYAEVKRRDLTGAVGKADVEGMLKSTGANIAEALAGRVAGVQVSSNEGMPGSDMNIVIRGTNSITGSNSPLYVVDGFPLEEGASISSLNKNDIENMEILKDASATAIYGARGANGVIIITTKKGQAGAPVITYNGTYGVQDPSKRIALMDAYEFVKLQLDRSASSGAAYLKADANGKVWTLEDYRNAPQFNWQDQVLRQAVSQNHSLSISGGTEAARYVASLSYFNQDGIVINTGYNRIQGKIGNTIKKGNLTISLTANYSKSTQLGAMPSAESWSSSNNFFYSVWGYRPVTYPGVDLASLSEDLMDPTTTIIDYRVNPIKSQRNQYNQSITDNLNTNGFLEYEFIKGLKLKSTLGYTEQNVGKEIFNNSQTSSGGAFGADKINSTVSSAKRATWLNENTLSYNGSINKRHNFGALLGYTLQGSNNITTSAYVSQMKVESLGMGGMSSGTPTSTNYSSLPWYMMSYLGRFNYNYSSRYYITASFRADGSSKFPANNRIGYFPSGSLAWNFTEEGFMEPIKDVLSSGKLRLGYGVTGNNRVGEFASYSQFDLASALYPFNGLVSNSGPTPSSLANPNLRWESTTQWNLGTDISFYNQRIAFTVDVYQKNTKDLLLNAKLPLSSGQSTGTQNVGETSNKGIEFSITTRNIKSKDFNWTTNFNISFNKNAVVALADNQNSMLCYANFSQTFNTMPSYIAQVGQPLGLMYGYVYQGTYKYNDFNLVGDKYVAKPGVAVLSTENNLKPGYPKYKDLNHDGVIDTNDQTVIGSGAPVHIGGFSNEFTYKGLDLSIFFQWSFGNNILNANRYNFENPVTAQLNQFASYSNRWTPENPNSDIPSAASSGAVTSTQLFSSRVIEDGSFLRLKNISLGYTFDKNLMKLLNLQKVRVFASASDIWVLTSYSGYDPEVSVRNSALTPGFDFSSYPRAISINGGVNISF